MHVLMLLHSKYTTPAICAVGAKTIQYNNSPAICYVKIVATAAA